MIADTALEMVPNAVMTTNTVSGDAARAYYAISSRDRVLTTIVYFGLIGLFLLATVFVVAELSGARRFAALAVIAAIRRLPPRS